MARRRYECPVDLLERRGNVAPDMGGGRRSWNDGKLRQDVGKGCLFRELGIVMM